MQSWLLFSAYERYFLDRNKLAHKSMMRGAGGAGGRGWMIGEGQSCDFPLRESLHSSEGCFVLILVRGVLFSSL